MGGTYSHRKFCTEPHARRQIGQLQQTDGTHFLRNVHGGSQSFEAGNQRIWGWDDPEREHVAAR